MSRKIAILADTASGVLNEYWGEHTYILPLYINFTDKSYQDMIDIDAYKVFEKMEKEGIPKTSIASIGEIKNIIEKIKKDGYTDILAITISSGLSGVYNSINMAVTQEEDINIKVIDTKNIWLGAGFLLLYAQDLLKENPDIPFEEFYEKVSLGVKNSKLIFSLDSLKYLIAGGRVGKVVGTVGSLLKIMPIISCDEEEGIYQTLAKTRSTDKAIVEITGRIKDFMSKNKDKKHYIALTYKRDEGLMKKFEEILRQEIDTAQRYIKYETVTASIGVHSGPGVYGVGIFCF